MKKFTNYTQGTRGIRTEDGMVWIDAGQSAEIDPKDIVGEVPDLGKKSDAAEHEGAESQQAQIDDLTQQVADLTAERDALKAQIAKFDHNGDGKAGGSKAPAKS